MATTDTSPPLLLEELAELAEAVRQQELAGHSAAVTKTRARIDDLLDLLPRQRQSCD